MTRVISRFFLIPFIVVVVGTTEASSLVLRDFLLQYVGVRDYLVKLDIHFHVKNVEGEFVDTDLSVKTVIRNGSDFYIEFYKPEIVSGIEFVYLSQKQTLITRYNDHEEVFPGAQRYFHWLKSVADIFAILAKEEAFEVETETQDGDFYRVRLLPKTRRVLSILGVDYSVINVILERQSGRYIPREFDIYNSLENEYMKVKVTEFKSGEEVLREFPHIPGGVANEL